MYIYDYDLCSIYLDDEGNECYKTIDLKQIEHLENRDMNSFKEIDSFTSVFDNIYQLYNFLLKEDLIDSNTEGFIISMNKGIGGKDKIITKNIETSIPTSGKKIMFKDDIKFIKSLYIRDWLKDINNGPKIVQVMDKYIELMGNAKDNKIKKVYEQLKSKISFINKADMRDEGNEVLKDYNEVVENFMKTLENDFKISAGEKYNYKKMRDFIALLSYVEYPLSNRMKRDDFVLNESDDIESIFKYGTFEHEEFITVEEAKKVNKRRM